MSEDWEGLKDVKSENLATAKRPSKRLKVIGAYLIRDPRTGKLYAGSSKNIGTRLNEHRSTLRGGNHANIGMRELMSGREVGELEVQIVECSTREEAYSKEQVLLEHYSETGLLLNRAKDSRNNRKFVWTEEEKRAQSERLTGHVKSQETCNKLSEALTGRSFGLEHRNALSVAAKDRMSKGPIEQLSKQAERSKKPVVVDDISFESAAQAAMHFGLKETTMLYRLSSTSAQFQNWQYKENKE